MLFSLAKTVTGLLALGQALDTVYAYPNRDIIRSEHGVSVQETQFGDKDHFESTLEQRTTPTPEIIDCGQESTGTWRGLVEEKPGSQWDDNTHEMIVYTAWKKTQSGKNPPPVLVAGLWVPKEGVFMGSIPHGVVPGSGYTAQALFDSRATKSAPILWSVVSERTYGPSTTKWHAEDMAMLVYESERRPTGTKYPPGSRMFVWGQYNSADKGGVKPPCRRDGPTNDEEAAWINPSCSDVLRKLGIYDCY
jgi:hypothetical protein